MVIALDFHGTITLNPKLFRDLAQGLINAGHTIYIVSAVKRVNVSKLQAELKKSKVPYNHLEIVLFNDYLDVPKLKAAACKRLGVRFLIDDNPETCRLAGILTAQISQ